MPQEKKIISKDLKVNHRYPENIQSLFASNFLVQHQPDFFTLSFFDVDFPRIITNDVAVMNEAMQGVESVEAKCISKIVLTPDTMRKLIQAVNQNMANYQELMELRRKDQGGKS